MSGVVDRVREAGKTGFWVIVLTFLLSGQSLLISHSKSLDGYKYNTTSAVLLAEIIKFFLAIFLLRWEGLELNFRVNKDTLLYSIPAIIYSLQNNLVFVALSHMDPTTYQILVNLKILTTGVLFRIVMGKELSSLQWSALFLLAVGCAVSQTPCETSSGVQTSFIGVIVCIIVSCMSPAAGIATEWIMKKSTLKKDPLHSQNMHLYFFGIISNFIAYVDEPNFMTSSFFEGYTLSTGLVVLSYAFTGLTVSLIMKYADNMVKIYSVAVSMALTLVLSVLFMGQQPTSQMFFGISIITVSILMYFNVVTPEISQKTLPTTQEGTKNT
ncbi:hypothetical protein PROFUN_08864 [Planoprotostelium fungivorum]|uniref:Uncharacterized protein n=1 Tax=Planoprotostelium fungivorum TaxID=1890364 RepID=A0A2P6NJ09_9EUKA|nr:hypothetical protein PROFUN_08864 [Planoprotostelium fungivorum]